MFEFEAKVLEAGDEFTVDDGAHWHVVQDTDHGVQVRITTTAGTVIELLPYEKVIVK